MVKQRLWVVSDFSVEPLIAVYPSAAELDISEDFSSSVKRGMNSIAKSYCLQYRAAQTDESRQYFVA